MALVQENVKPVEVADPSLSKVTSRRMRVTETRMESLLTRATSQANERKLTFPF